jgi:putative iron-dependent peroxidase
MPINAKKAQDVWKDVGQHVQFTVLKLKREDQAKDQAAVREFADRSQAIVRSLRIRDSHLESESGLKVAIGFSNSAWNYLNQKN